MIENVLSYDNQTEDDLVASSDPSLIRTCNACGKLFLPRGKRNVDRMKYCFRVHYSICPICGKEFKIDLSGGPVVRKACSRKCSNALKQQNMRKTLMETYGVDNPGQLPDHAEKTAKTCLERYGDESYSRTDDFKQKCQQTWAAKTPEEMQERLDKTIATNQARYGVDNGANASHVRAKTIATNQARYGKDWYRQTDECDSQLRATTKEKYGDEVYFRTQHYRDQVRETSLRDWGAVHFTKSERYKRNAAAACLAANGVTCIFQRPDIRKKSQARTSKLELRLHNMLESYNIRYESEYYIRTPDNHSHHFDVYLPDYNILIDVDGVYYHAYIEDPDGLKSRDDYDDVRLYCVPKDFIYLVLVESDFERELRRLQKVLQSIDANIFNYDSDLFNWCREIGFPYYNYSDDYLISQFNRLCSYEPQDPYNPSCQIGISLVNQFHRSIFDCRVGSAMSVREAWDDDSSLKRVIANRLIYKNSVDPSKILAGFNISKIAPKVSIFNPMLAKYIVQKYLSEFSTIFDPFSGFSGRMLGVVASSKRYIGQDIREISVKESNQIISFLQLHGAEITSKDIFCSEGTYECLFTCPPYSAKEIYVGNQQDLSCDEWIDVCISRFKCKRYVFVVDRTEKYSSFVQEEIKCKSHFRKNSEYLLVIDK